MTPEDRMAVAEWNRAALINPAEGATRPEEQSAGQVREETKRHFASTAIVGLVAVGVLFLLGKEVSEGKQPDIGSLLLLLALVLIQCAGPPGFDLLKGRLHGHE